MSTKLHKTELDYIINAIRTANLAKIDGLIIESNKVVRGADNARRVVMYDTSNVPELGFTIGLNRLDTFSNRLDMIDQSNCDISVELKHDDKDNYDWVRSIMFASKGIRVEYRCAQPRAITAPPKTLHDIDTFKFDLTDEDIDTLRRGQNAMKSEFVTLKCVNNKLEIEITDTNGDNLTYDINADVQNLIDDEDEVNFSYKYQIKLILPLLLNKSTSKTVTITKIGMFKIMVNGIMMYILPGV